MKFLDKSYVKTETEKKTGNESISIEKIEKNTKTGFELYQINTQNLNTESSVNTISNKVNESEKSKNIKSLGEF